MSDIQKKFYVLRAISGKENKVREYLEAELKNTDLGEYVSQVLIPTEKTFTVRNGKKVMKERAYLPGYVLVEAALVGEVAHRLRNIPNVIGFLGGSDNPVPLRPARYCTRVKLNRAANCGSLLDTIMEIWSLGCTVISRAPIIASG